MDQAKIAHEIAHVNVSTDNLQPPAEFSLHLTGPAVLVLALALAAIIRDRVGPTSLL